MQHQGVVGIIIVASIGERVGEEAGGFKSKGIADVDEEREQVEPEWQRLWGQEHKQARDWGEAAAAVWQGEKGRKWKQSAGQRVVVSEAQDAGRRQQKQHKAGVIRQRCPSREVAICNQE